MTTGEGSGDGPAALWGQDREGGLLCSIISIGNNLHCRLGSVGPFNRHMESLGEKIYNGEQNTSEVGLVGGAAIRPDNSQPVSNFHAPGLWGS